MCTYSEALPNSSPIQPTPSKLTPLAFDVYGHWLGDIDDDHARFAAGEAEITAARAVVEAAE